MPGPAEDPQAGRGPGCRLGRVAPSPGRAGPSKVQPLPSHPPPPAPPVGPERGVLHSLFARTETREHISIGGKLYFFFYGDKGRGIISPDSITPIK